MWKLGGDRVVNRLGMWVESVEFSGEVIGLLCKLLGDGWMQKLPMVWVRRQVDVANDWG